MSLLQLVHKGNAREVMNFLSYNSYEYDLDYLTTPIKSHNNEIVRILCNFAHINFLTQHFVARDVASKVGNLVAMNYINESYIKPLFKLSVNLPFCEEEFTMEIMKKTKTEELLSKIREILPDNQTFVICASMTSGTYVIDLNHPNIFQSFVRFVGDEKEWKDFNVTIDLTSKSGKGLSQMHFAEALESFDNLTSKNVKMMEKVLSMDGWLLKTLLSKKDISARMLMATSTPSLSSEICELINMGIDLHSLPNVPKFMCRLNIEETMKICIDVDNDKALTFFSYCKHQVDIKEILKYAYARKSEKCISAMKNNYHVFGVPRASIMGLIESMNKGYTKIPHVNSMVWSDKSSTIIT